jgi:hypothetical protein
MPVLHRFSAARTTITLEADDKEWLERKAQAEGVSMAELVRKAIRRLRQQEDVSFEKLLKQTGGLRQGGDGLAYQRRLRKKWR